MQNFLSLSTGEQQDLLFKFGRILISSSQGSTTTIFYSLYGYFVKVTKDITGINQIQVLPNLDDLQLNIADL